MFRKICQYEAHVAHVLKYQVLDSICSLLQGTARRKKKVVHRTATADDKKLQFSLKKLGVNNISGIEEVRSGPGLDWSSLPL